MKKKQKRKKIRIKALIIIVLFIYLFVMALYYILNIPVKSIIVKNNNLVSEQEILNTVNINSSTALFRINTRSYEKKLIKKLPLINSVKIKKSLLGEIVINIQENRILFLDVLSNLLVLSNGTSIEATTKYLGYPVLVNYVPSEVKDSFINGFKKVDPSIMVMISEIEYSPDKYNDVTVDKERFILRMNDGNKVYINTVNIEKLNKYQSIYSTVGGNGVLYLDSSSKNYIFKNSETETKEEKGNVNED